MLELKIPEAGESIQEVQIAQWLKQEGQWVEKDEEVVELETDKVALEVNAPSAGVARKLGMYMEREALRPDGVTRQIFRL